MKLKIFLVLCALAVIGLFSAGAAKYDQKQKQLRQEQASVITSEERLQSSLTNSVQSENKQILDLNAQKTQLCVFVRGLPQFAKNPAALPAPCQATAADKQN